MWKNKKFKNKLHEWYEIELYSLHNSLLLCLISWWQLLVKPKHVAVNCPIHKELWLMVIICLCTLVTTGCHIKILDQRIRIWFPVEGVDLSCCHPVKTISRPTIPPIQWLLKRVHLVKCNRCMIQTIQCHVISNVMRQWSYTPTRRSRLTAGCNANYLAFTYWHCKWLIQGSADSQKWWH